MYLHLKGIDKLREKLPAYPGNRIAILPLRGLFAAIVGYLFLIVLDIIPRLFGDIVFLAATEPYLPIIGSIFIAGLALWLIGKLWNKREAMKEKYGDLAYQRIIMNGVTGVFLVPPIVFHAFTSIRSLPPVPPINELTILWSQSMLPFVGVPVDIDVLLRMAISFAFIIIGALTVRSAVLTFGLDYMTVVYLYFPEESEVQENEIYSVVRHPAYLGGVLLGLAGFLFRFSFYSMIFFIIIYLVFRLQIRREEIELRNRFGESYTEYMKKVPALLVKPSKIGAFFRFLSGRSND